MMPQPVQNIPSHLNCQSLRRSRSRPSPGSGGTMGVVPVGHYQTPGGVSSKSLIQENPYQQPYLGRGAGLSDSPTSDNASDATLTDSELPMSNQNMPLQNGGLLLGSMDYGTTSGKLNSLKRNMNTNGKSSTGIGMVNQSHGNHDNLIDQFVVHTSGGKIYIPQDTPKNPTSDYKSSPGSSPTKKISTSLLYKDAVNMGTLRDGRSITKSDDDDFLYKVKRFCCTCNKPLAITLFLLIASVVVNILFGVGALPWGSDSAKCLGESTFDDNNHGMRQSTPGLANGTYISRLDKSPSSSGDVVSLGGILLLAHPRDWGRRKLPLYLGRSGILKNLNRAKRSFDNDPSTGSDDSSSLSSIPSATSASLLNNPEMEEVEEEGRRTFPTNSPPPIPSHQSSSHPSHIQTRMNKVTTTSSKLPIKEQVEEAMEYSRADESSSSSPTFNLPTSFSLQISSHTESPKLSWGHRNLNFQQENPLENEFMRSRVGKRENGMLEEEDASLYSTTPRKSGLGMEEGEEMDDGWSGRHILEHLIQAVNPEREYTSSSSPVMNIEETTEKVEHTEDFSSYSPQPPPFSFNHLSQENQIITTTTTTRPSTTTPTSYLEEETMTIQEPVSDSPEEEVSQFLHSGSSKSESNVEKTSRIKDTSRTNHFPEPKKVLNTAEGDSNEEAPQADQPPLLIHVLHPYEAQEEAEEDSGKNSIHLDPAWRYFLAKPGPGGDEEDEKDERTPSRGTTSFPPSISFQYSKDNSDKSGESANYQVDQIFDDPIPSSFVNKSGEMKRKLGNESHHFSGTEAPLTTAYKKVSQDSSPHNTPRLAPSLPNNYPPHQIPTDSFLFDQLSFAEQEEKASIEKSWTFTRQISTTATLHPDFYSSQPFQASSQIPISHKPESQSWKLDEGTENNVVEMKPGTGGQLPTGVWEMLHQGSHSYIRWNQFLRPAPNNQIHQPLIFHRYVNNSALDHFSGEGSVEDLSQPRNPRYQVPTLTNQTSEQINMLPLTPTSLSPLLADSTDVHGGACQCFCPCLDSSQEFNYDNPSDDLQETSTTRHPPDTYFPDLGQDKEEFIIILPETSSPLQPSSSQEPPETTPPGYSEDFFESSSITSDPEIFSDAQYQEEKFPIFETETTQDKDASDSFSSTTSNSDSSPPPPSHSFTTSFSERQDAFQQQQSESTSGEPDEETHTSASFIDHGQDFLYRTTPLPSELTLEESPWYSTSELPYNNLPLDSDPQSSSSERIPTSSSPLFDNPLNQDDDFEWVECACSRGLSPTQMTTLTQDQESPGIRSFPAVNFPPVGTSFAQITLGSRLSNLIGAYSYWNMQFYQSDSAYVTWEMSVPRGASVGFYARRNALPTHTNYDLMEILRGFKTRSKRSSPPSVTKEITKFIEQGHWFISIYNDNSDPQEVIFASSISQEMTEGCPNGCSGNGQCQAGHCQCNGGFGGDDCSQSICPVLCSGRGEYLNGECQCNPGWKGKECNLRHDECEISDCSGHGKCVNGKCACIRGYKGEFCQEVDCLHPTCSGHGFCMAGSCICKKGWRGADCAQPDNEALQCLPDCSGHGVFNLETQNCTCEPKWTGEDCSQELCDTNCGAHGMCIGGGCQCSEGWTGQFCNQRVCDKRCGDHGQCKNGTCLCVTGWNGRHCTLEGCPNSCSGHGQCKANHEGFWECKCHSGWTGLECSVMMEQSCNDGQDNDKDGLTDCEDPECCLITEANRNSQCATSQLCVAAKKPIDILLRKQPPAITASFFEKMKFLIEEGSLQNYARQEAFNGSRSGVVRGRVVTPNGSGLMGVRVSSSSPLEPLGGFTLTQDDGWFDLMVNGGGAVTLHFGRSPFNPRTRTIFVPWNEVVIIDTVVMGALDGEDKVFVRGQSCDSHDYDLMKPVVLATWKHGFQGDCSETSTILIESQVVQESIKIPGTGLHLMYHSSRVQGYLSTIQLQLTPETIPLTLRRIHLRITIEGVLFEKIFEADPDIKFTYAWNRLNVYRQRVYGVTTAIVKVGYEYSNCASILWDVQSTTLSGHDMSISDIGGWNLDIHHRYNFHEGIIQKGDGTNIYLKHRPRVIITTMGNGYHRSLDCNTECNGIASKQRLLAPVALQAAPDGSVFVGDFDLIRRMMIDGTVHNVVKLNATRVSYRYHMALSPVDNLLYISDPESHQIIRVRNIEDSSDPERNWEPVVGSGERCLPGDEAHCGDEAPARDAKLAYPKGVAVSSDNVLYFADGTNIRKVDKDGIITTVIGNHQHKSHWKPIPCEGTLKVEEVHLRWPTELTINPLDNSLYIIDDHMILKLTEDNRIRIIAGRPFHCTVPAGGYDMDLATHTSLISPQSMTFASNGDLYIAESDSQRINRIRVITTDGKISHFAGAESKCNCVDLGCTCYEEDYYLAATSKFNTISAICMTPDGVLHVSDQGNYRIRSIMASIPQAQPTESRQYEIYSPETQEIYIFNRFGQHVATKNIVTGETIYTFLYNVNMSNGKLSSVTDSSGNKIQILRDYSQQVKSIENSQAQKFNLKMSRVRMLSEFSTPEGYNLTFDYHGATGLIKSRQDSSGRSSVYSYDEFGRLTMAISPTGQVVTLTFDLSQKGASVKVTRDGNLPETILIRGSSIYKRQGKMEEITSLHPDGSVVRQFPWGQVITTESVPYNILTDISPILSDSFPIPGKQRTEIAGDLVNRVEWRYVPRKEGRGKNKQVVQIDKKMRINGENILMIEYDRETKSEIILTDERTELLNVSYDRSSRPFKWSPRAGFAPVELEYDRFGRLIRWKWDELNEVYEYDRSGRLFKIDYVDGTSLTLAFKDLIENLPVKMTTAGGSDYLIEYDGSGAFKSLTTPRGHIHNFGISTSIGAYDYMYRAPSSRDVYKIQYNDLGQILTIIYPQGSGRVNYVYNRYSKLEAFVAGLRSAKFSYQENSGLLKVAEVSQSSFDVKTELKYHGGMVKEEKEKYGSTTGLDNVHLKYQYDGNGRISEVEVEINGKHVQGLALRKNQNTGMLEAVADLSLYQTAHKENFYRSFVVTDASKNFQKIAELDKVNRLRRVNINVKGSDVFRLDIDYDGRGKIKHRKLTILKSSYAENIVYDADGHVLEVQGSGNWKYVYDENGNIIQIMEQGEKSSLIYDSGDRVIQVGELFRYTYDPRGFLVQRGNEKFQYDDKGFLLHAVKKDVYKVWFFYDHLDRLVSWKDDQGNVTQFLYANPESPHLITHVHFPFWGKNYVFHYDTSDALVSLVSSSDSQKYYVATDQNNSPVGVFNSGGNVVKEIHRSPFGKVIRDTNPEFYLPLDFGGGVVDRKTGIVIIKGRPYDPSIGQWMVPHWHTLSATLKSPTDIFTYRHTSNDPITPPNPFAATKMTTLKDWLSIFGYDVQRIFGQDYLSPRPVEHTVATNPHLVPEFGVVPGLDCMAKTVTMGFKDLGFRRTSKLKVERLLSRMNEWDLMNKIAYKRAAFGPGLLISRVESGKTLISTVDNSVVQGVITSVLNGSLAINFKSIHQNTFYFVKDNPHKLRDDMEELKRLGGLYNISVHDAENGIKELRLATGDTSIAVRYGTDGEEEYGRLVKHAHRRAIEKAWEEEKMYISMGLDGRRAWTEEEKEQLLAKGQVHGYRPTDLYSVHKFPQLADDPSNVIFQRDSRRKRRKSNKRHHPNEHSSSSSLHFSISSTPSSSELMHSTIL